MTDKIKPAAKASKPAPSHAPVYAAALYPQLVVIARKHGYALAAHGSLQRDFDLIGVPWVDAPGTPEDVVAEITSTFAVREVGGPPSDKPHGRRTWSLSIGFGDCFIDLSFMPTRAAVQQAVTVDDVGAEDRFEQYVATLIAKAPDVQKLGERLADWLDDDRFNSIDPILIGLARQLAQTAVPRVPEGMVERIDAAIRRVVDGHAPRRIPADATDVDLVLAEVRSWIDGKWPPFWIATTGQDQEVAHG